MGRGRPIQCQDLVIPRRDIPRQAALALFLAIASSAVAADDTQAMRQELSMERQKIAEQMQRLEQQMADYQRQVKRIDDLEKRLDADTDSDDSVLGATETGTASTATAGSPQPTTTDELAVEFVSLYPTRMESTT